MARITAFPDSFMKTLWRLPLVAVLALGFLAGTDAAARDSAAWRAAWGTSQQGLDAAAVVSDTTVRMIVRPTLPGSHVRVQPQNTFGTVPLDVGAASIAARANGALLVPGTLKALTFGGSPSVSIPAGGAVYSDPVAFEAHAWQDLAVSLYLPGSGVPVSRHSNARKTSFVAPNGAGNRSADEAATAFTTLITSMWWVANLDVLTSQADGTIVFFGDSITDGTGTTTDGHDRWHDIVVLRMQLDRKGKTQFGAVNQGIGGNRVTNIFPGGSPAAVDRLDRDVLARSGATHVVLFEGTNDIQAGVTADQLIAGIQNVIDRVHAARLPIIGATIIPRHNATWTPQMTQYRNIVNEWIRHKANFDGVIDFDRLIRSAADPDLMNPILDLGDHIHPNPFGYFLMGREVELKLFEKHVPVK
jgi:lysophospholipase L1-like esterase